MFNTDMWRLNIVLYMNFTLKGCHSDSSTNSVSCCFAQNLSNGDFFSLNPQILMLNLHFH